MSFYMNLWEEAPALWKEWESRPNASRGAVPVGERLMHWHMEKASFHHVRAFPGETTRRELRQRKLAKSPQITLQAEETQGTAAPASAGQIESPSKQDECIGHHERAITRAGCAIAVVGSASASAGSDS